MAQPGVGALFAVAALLVATTRVFSHVHHIQDVVAGLAFGIIAFGIAWYLVRLTLAGLARHQARIRLPLIGDLDLAPVRPARPERAARAEQPARATPVRPARRRGEGPGQPGALRPTDLLYPSALPRSANRSTASGPGRASQVVQIERCQRPGAGPPLR